MTDNELEMAHRCSDHHREQILASESCGCFYCLSIFPPVEIVEWIDERDSKKSTALCPKCGIDSVIGSLSGYPITKKFLSEMKRYWFDS